MHMHTYWKSEPHLYTVGYIDREARVPMADFDNAQDAIDLVRELNGGHSTQMEAEVRAIARHLEKIERGLHYILQAMGRLR